MIHERWAGVSKPRFQLDATPAFQSFKTWPPEAIVPPKSFLVMTSVILSYSTSEHRGEVRENESTFDRSRLLRDHSQSSTTTATAEEEQSE